MEEEPLYFLGIFWVPSTAKGLVYIIPLNPHDIPTKWV